MTEFLCDEEIERIARGVIARDLPKREWTHAAHLAFALWMVRRRPAHAERVGGFIRAYNAATGVANTASSGYHETITRASMRAVAAFAAGYPSATPLHVVATGLVASPLGAPDWLLTFWSRKRLFSPQARRAWVEPDLRPFAPETSAADRPALSSSPPAG